TGGAGRRRRRRPRIAALAPRGSRGDRLADPCCNRRLRRRGDSLRRLASRYAGWSPIAAGGGRGPSLAAGLEELAGAPGGGEAATATFPPAAQPGTRPAAGWPDPRSTSGPPVSGPPQTVSPGSRRVLRPALALGSDHARPDHRRHTMSTLVILAAGLAWLGASLTALSEA